MSSLAEDIDCGIPRASSTGDGTNGAGLIDRTLADLAREADCQHYRPSPWDSRVADLNVLTTKIPPIVQERCRTVRHAIQCGLLSSVQYAWASADSLLHLWNYRQESPYVLTVAGDSPIISVAVCPPRPGVFDSNVHLLLVLCTHLTVTLHGLHFEQGRDLLHTTGATATAPSVAPVSGMFGAGSPGALGAPLGVPVSMQVSSQQPPGALPGFGMGAAQAIPTATGAGRLSSTPGGLPAGQQARSSVAQPGAGGLHVFRLEGYYAKTDGAKFHCVRCTGDGHILLHCGVPQVYELAYSRRTNWMPLPFHAKCRLVRHWRPFSGLRRFVSSAVFAMGRIRVLECAQKDYVMVVDDAGCLRLNVLVNRSVHRFESVSLLEEVAFLTMDQLAKQAACEKFKWTEAGIAALTEGRAASTFGNPKPGDEVPQDIIAVLKEDGHWERSVQQGFVELHQVHLASLYIAHVFPTLGLDGHLRARVVTGAGERLVFVCTADSADFFRGVETDVTERGPPLYSARRFYGFKLQQEITAARTYDARDGRVSTGIADGSAPMFDTLESARRNRMFVSGSGSAASADVREPCLCSSGVVLAATPPPDTSIPMHELHVQVRVDSSSVSPDPLDLIQKLRFDAPVLDIVEERYFYPGRERLPEVPPDGEPSSFRGSRCFAVLFPDAVRVLHITFKVQSLHRQPATAGECCQHFVQMALPPYDSVTSTSASSLPWTWSFDDARAPSFEEQKRCMRIAKTLPPIHLGRWFDGLLKFFALVLRPLWDVPLITTIHGKQFVMPRNKRFELPFEYQAAGLCLRHSEGAVQRTLARLRPALRFAQQALSQLPSTSSSAGSGTSSSAQRSKLFCKERKMQSEGLALVYHRLREVVEVADRAQQVLAFMRVFHAQRSAYRVLQSTVLQGSELSELFLKPLSELVCSPEALSPVAKLCTAFIIESGLTTPSSELIVDSTTFQHRAIDGVTLSGGNGRARDVCRELEKQCPGIFALVDLDLCFARARVEGGAVASATTGDVLSRCVQAVSSNSMEDRWEVLAQSIRTMALEDMRGAAEICIDKVQQLQSSNEFQTTTEAVALGRAKVLFEALLSALSPFPEEQSCALVEYLLTKTARLHFRSSPDRASDSQGAPRAATSAATTPGSAVPPVQGIILDYLLVNKRLHRILEVLLDKYVTDIETFLKGRCDKNRMAGEVLWKYHLRHGRFGAASSVLQHLAEWHGRDCTLSERVQYLELAKQAASRAGPQFKDTLEKVTLLCDVTIRVQVPLHQELRIVAGDGRVQAKWHRLAQQRCEQLQQLCSLQVLYQIAVDFGLYHVVLVISDLSSSVQEQDVSSSNWVRAFFPQTSTPYSASEMSTPPAVRPHSIFPLLLVRRCATFFAQGESASMLPEVSAVKTEDFRLRASRLLEELATVTKVPGPTWDVRCIATLLEYCNCLWLKSLEVDEVVPLLPPPLPPPAAPPDASEGDAAPAAAAVGDEPAGREPLHSRSRAWIALQILPQQPFNLGPGSVVKFYADMLAHLPAWLRDLQVLLPADPTGCRPAVGEEDVYLHLSAVVLSIVGEWLSRVQHNGPRTHAAADFRLAWPAAESLLASLQSRLGDEVLQSRQRYAVQLLQEAKRLEETGRAI